MNHVYTRIVHAHIRVNSSIYAELFCNRPVFIWFETTSLRVAKVNNNRPAASLVTKVFEYFYIVQTPDAGTSKLAGFPASGGLFLYTVMFSTSEKAFGFANGFGGIRCYSPEPERPAVPDVRPNYTPRVDYARNDRRAGNNGMYVHKT